MESPLDVAMAADRLARGDVVAHGFANLYALTTLPDATTVRATNSLKGRPVGQVGSVTTTPSRMTSLWDLAALPPGLSSDAVHALLDALYGLGPCGFRGAAAEHVPGHLTSTDGGRATVQLIAPGYACPSNRFLAAALAVAQTPFLHITSANRSRHVTGATDEPAHSRAEALRAEFATVPRVVLLEHDEDAARVRYPRHEPMSTTVLALDRTEVAPTGGWPWSSSGTAHCTSTTCAPRWNLSASPSCSARARLGGSRRAPTTTQMRTQRSAGAIPSVLTLLHSDPAPLKPSDSERAGGPAAASALILLRPAEQDAICPAAQPLTAAPTNQQTRGLSAASGRLPPRTDPAAAPTLLRPAEQVSRASQQPAASRRDRQPVNRGLGAVRRLPPRL